MEKICGLQPWFRHCIEIPYVGQEFPVGELLGATLREVWTTTLEDRAPIHTGEAPPTRGVEENDNIGARKSYRKRIVDVVSLADPGVTRMGFSYAPPKIGSIRFLTARPPKKRIQMQDAEAEPAAKQACKG